MTLFFERWKRQWKGYRVLYDQFFDVTMMLYTVVFAGAASFYFIRETIVEGHFGAFAYISEIWLVLLVLTCCTMLRPQSMTEEADRLFWLHSPNYVTMKRCAFYYSFVMHSIYITVVVSLVAILLLPLHNWSISMCLQLVLIGVAVQHLTAYVRIVLPGIWRRRITLLLIVFAVAASAMYALYYTSISSAVLLCVVLYVYDRHIIQTNRFFAKLVASERQHQFRWQSRLFVMSAQLRDVKPQWHHHKRPRTFKRVYATTATGALQELVLKAIWRNRTYRVNILQIVGLSFIALLFLPIWANYILAVLLIVALLMFLEAVVIKLQTHPIFRVISYTKEQWFYAQNDVKYRFALPFPLIYCIVTTIKWYFV